MRPAVREKKKVSLWFNNRHTLGQYHGLNQSEIVKADPPPPLIGRDPDTPVRLCKLCLKMLVLQSDRERGE